MNYELLEQLTAIQGVASDESRIKAFILDYIEAHSSGWKVQPVVLDKPWLQDNIVLIFGKPTTAIYAHTDTIGYSIGYANDLIRVGGPRNIDGTLLVGIDNGKEITAEVMMIETEHGDILPHYVSTDKITPGTLMSFAPNFRETSEYVQSQYLDNRLGVFNALKVAETLENGVIVFGTYEEHGGEFRRVYCQLFVQRIWNSAGVDQRYYMGNFTRNARRRSCNIYARQHASEKGLS